MDGDADVSLAIRRARRAGAKQLDLSRRGLREWPDGLFSLRQLESLDVSGNYLTFVDSGVAQLEMLQELNLADNKLDKFPEFATSSLPHLRSLVIDGNPVASKVPQSTLRQLARPSAAPGQSPSQVIRGLLGNGATGDVGSTPPRPTSAAQQRGGDDMSGLDALLEGDDTSPWRKQQKVLLKEVEQLQAKVQELEGKLAAGGGGAKSGEPALPSWLQQESNTGSKLSQTLPSRRSAFHEGDEAADLKEQLREEQRKNKRLEKDVQRLSDRMNEQDLKAGGVGSVPHFALSEVEIGDTISQGGFSIVQRGMWHGTKVAVKKLFDPNINEELLAEFDNEVQKLEQIRHPNILMLLAVHRKPPALSMITEMVEGGSLFQLIHSPQKFNSATGPITGVPVRQMMDILECSGSAIAFLHARGIAHRDIKSHNVLLSPHFEVKLCDFGLARMRSELMTGTMQFAGTPNYMAPEIFRNQKYTETVDVFAYGTMLWESLALDIPFANLDPPDIRDKVINGQMLAMPSSATPALQSIIRMCWTLESDLRDPTVQLVCLETTKGPIRLRIVPCWAPRGSQRFLQLVTDRYFEELAIYRAVPNFLIQFGVTDDPMRKNAYEAIKDDFVRGVPVQDGTVCFAASGPDTRTATICIFLGTFEQLGKNRWEAPIGQVCPESLEVLHSVYTGWGDLPQCGGVGPDPVELAVLGSSYILHNFPGIDFVEQATWVEH